MVIDMQKGSFTSKSPRFDTKGVVMRINELAGYSEKVIYQLSLYSMMELVVVNSKKTQLNGKY